MTLQEDSSIFAEICGRFPGDFDENRMKTRSIVPKQDGTDQEVTENSSVIIPYHHLRQAQQTNQKEKE